MTSDSTFYLDTTRQREFSGSALNCDPIVLQMRHLQFCVSHMRTRQTCHPVWYPFAPYIWSCGLITTDGGCRFSRVSRFIFRKKTFPSWLADMTQRFILLYDNITILCVVFVGDLMFNNYSSWFKPLFYLLFQIMPEQAQPIRKDVTYVNPYCLPCVLWYLDTYTVVCLWI